MYSRTTCFQKGTLPGSGSTSEAIVIPKGAKYVVIYVSRESVLTIQGVPAAGGTTAAAAVAASAALAVTALAAVEYSYIPAQLPTLIPVEGGEATGSGGRNESLYLRSADATAGTYSVTWWL